MATSNPPILVFITFDGGSAKVRAEAKPILDEMAAVISAHPEIELVQVEGHALATEGKSVSQARADAVRAALIARGVDPSRVRAKGFLAHCPRFAGNDPRNRRVEVVVAKANGNPGATLGCPVATAAGVVSDPVP